MKKSLLAMVLIAAAAGCARAPAPSAAAAAPSATSRFSYADVVNFYRIYDAAGGRPDAATLQRDYLEAGSAGVRDFIPNRIISAERLAARIAEQPSIYRDARRCLELMPAAEASFARSMERFLTLYPEARQPDVYFVIGRNNSGGTATAAGVLFGLEVICRAESPSRRPLQDRLNSLIAHEVGHASQPQESGTTLLEAALREGVAELVAELTTGEIANDHLKAWTRGREAEIERAFRGQLRSTDLREWLYNGVGTPERPGDLAYWVGYRIARAYYDRARDKRAALRRLLAASDPEAILRDSGWSERG